VLFERDDFYVGGVSVGSADLRFLVRPGDPISVQVQPTPRPAAKSGRAVLASLKYNLSGSYPDPVVFEISGDRKILIRIPNIAARCSIASRISYLPEVHRVSFLFFTIVKYHGFPCILVARYS
jgi:hypothetical protein